MIGTRSMTTSVVIKDSYIFTYYVNDSSDEFYNTFIAGVENKIKDVKNFVKHRLVNYLANEQFLANHPNKKCRQTLMVQYEKYIEYTGYTREQLINLVNKFIEVYLQNESEREKVLRIFNQELYGNGTGFCKFMCEKLAIKYTEHTEIWFDIIYDNENQDFDYFELLDLNTKEDMKNWKHRYHFDHFRTLVYCVSTTKIIVNNYNIKTKKEMDNLIYELIKEFVLTR